MPNTTQGSRSYIKQELKRGIGTLGATKNHLVNAGTPFLNNIALLTQEDKPIPEIYNTAVDTITEVMGFIEEIEKVITSLDEQI